MEGNLKLLIGVFAGIAIALGVFILTIRWRRGARRRKGRRAEKAVASLLKKLPGRNNIVFNDLILPSRNGRTVQIDHLVVSRRGIFIIETKSHAGRISGSEHAQYWQQNFESGSRSFYNPLLQNQAHLRSLQQLLPQIDSGLFLAITLFTGSWRLDIRAEDIIVERRLLPDRHIPRTFRPSEERKRRWWRLGKEVRLDSVHNVILTDELLPLLRRGKKVVSRDEIREIAGKIEAAMKSAGVTNTAHARYAQNAGTLSADKIRQGICPRCGSPLRICKGDKGEFVGCSGYPDCRFVCSIDRVGKTSGLLGR